MRVILYYGTVSRTLDLIYWPIWFRWALNWRNRLPWRVHSISHYRLNHHL